MNNTASSFVLLFLLGAALLSPYGWIASWALPGFYFLWMVFIRAWYKQASLGEPKKRGRFLLELTPILVFLLFVKLVPETLFDGLAEIIGRGGASEVDEFNTVSQVFFGLVISHLVYLWLTRTNSSRSLAQNSILLTASIGMILGLIAFTTRYSHQDSQRGLMVDATVVENQVIDLNGGPIPRHLGPPRMTRYGEYIVVFIVRFSNQEQERQAILWRGDFYPDRRLAEKLASANPPNSHRKLYLDSSRGTENAVLHLEMTSELDAHWKKRWSEILDRHD